MTIFVALLFFLTFFNVTAGQCFTEHNIPGMALKGLTFKRFLVKAPYVCDFKCDQDVRCQSFNYVIRENVCELNNLTKEEKPEHFVRDPERFYIKHLLTVSRKGRSCTAVVTLYWLQKKESCRSAVTASVSFPLLFLRDRAALETSWHGVD